VPQVVSSFESPPRAPVSMETPPPAGNAP
jgi:hypothetical protein